MIPALVSLFEVLACIGFGGVIIRGFGISSYFDCGERLAWSFALGFGVLAWLVFFLGIAGILSPMPLAVLIAIGVGISIFVRKDALTVCRRVAGWSPSATEKILMAGLFVILALDLIESMAPPSDADTLAYHFALPKQFLRAGRIEFVPRALDGAVPMLVQMTYVPALSLGGELALTLWTMLSGWACAALLFVLCRRHLDPLWSLGVIIVFTTTPAIIYGSGNGQVEVKLALFAMVAAYSAGLALKSNYLGFAAVAGLAAGFFMAGKYTGLLFAVACGVVVLYQKRWLAHVAVMVLAGVVAGSQWYVWNWVHTGDPVFPMLYPWLKEVVDYRYWDQAHADFIKSHYFDLETPAPNDLLWFFWYPLQATFAGLPEFDSGRVGLGLFGVLLSPFTVAALWHFRNRLTASILFPIGVVVILFYGLWFFSGSSQKIRHLVPIYPLFLICVCTAVNRWANVQVLRAVAGAFIVTLTVQAAGFLVYSNNTVRFAFSGDTRAAYLEENVSLYAPVPWINENLSTGVRLFTEIRQIIYFLDVPHFFGIPIGQVLVDLRPGVISPGRLVRQLHEQRITHLLVAGGPIDFAGPYAGLVETNCARIGRIFDVQKISSRTLRGLQANRRGSVALLELTPDTCSPLANQ